MKKIIHIIFCLFIILLLGNNTEAFTCENFDSQEECDEYLDNNKYETKNVKIEEITETSANISWETTVPVEITPTYYYFGSDNKIKRFYYWDNKGVKTEHLVNLTNLKPGTNYYIDFQAYDPMIESNIGGGVEHITFKTLGTDPNILDYYREDKETPEDVLQLTESQKKIISNYPESTLVDFKKHNVDNPIITKYLYSSEVEIAIGGFGRANGRIKSDAYYYFGDDFGDYSSGGIIAETEERFYGLYINGQKITDIYYRSYSTDHFYELKIEVGDSPRPIEFYIGDDQIWDNSGSLTIWLKGNYQVPSEEIERPVEVESITLKQNRAVSDFEQNVIEREKELVKNISQSLVNRVKGRILLQIEEHGEAWYVDPVSENKFYMRNGTAAFEIMKAFGLGIKNDDIDKIPIGYKKSLYTGKDSDLDGIPDAMEVAINGNPYKINTNNEPYDDMLKLLLGQKLDSYNNYQYNQSIINKLKGKILLQVELNGEAWYVNPTDSKRYFLGDPDTAYNIMRYLSLGITNNDLRRIQVGELEKVKSK